MILTVEEVEKLDPLTISEAQRVSEEMLSQMSAVGSLRLPPALDAVRVSEGIPDDAFRSMPLFDRIYVWQISDADGEKFKGTVLYMPETSKRRELESNPRGILIGAGLKALDQLRSNGVDLGHTVEFIRNSPWHLRVGAVDGKEVYVLVLRAGDIVGSETLMQQLRAGKMEVVQEKEADGAAIHVFKTPDGGTRAPGMAWIADDC